MVTSKPSSKNLLNYKGHSEWQGKYQELLAGPAWTLFYTLSDYYGFNMTFEIVPLPGHWNGTHWDGSLGCVVYRDCDVDMYSMSLMIFNPYTLESAQGIKFQALNTWVDGFAFLCTLPKEKPKFWNILLPFSPFLWFLYIGLFVTVCLLFLLNSAGYRAMGSTDSDMIDNLLLTFRITFGRDIPSSKREAKKSNYVSRNILLIFWCFTALIFLWFFQTTLLSCLVRPFFEAPINNLDDFLASDKVLVIKRSCKCIRLFLGWLLRDILDSLQSKDRLLNMEEDFYNLAQLSQPDINQCRLTKESIGRYFEHKFQASKAETHFKISNEYLVKYIMGWNIKETDDLGQKLSATILRLEETGVLKKV